MKNIFLVQTNKRFTKQKDIKNRKQMKALISSKLKKELDILRGEINK